MNAFLVHVGDDNFCRVLPKALDRSKSPKGRVKVMAFPPLGIQTLAPILRRRGHGVRLFDTCHPQMKEAHIAQAAAREQPDVVALSFLSTTTYPAVKSMARRIKAEAARVPIVVGGPFATLNADRILGDCPDVDCVGVGEGEELLPDHVEHLEDPASVAGLVWRRDGETVTNTPRPLLRDLDQFRPPPSLGLVFLPPVKQGQEPRSEIVDTACHIQPSPLVEALPVLAFPVLEFFSCHHL